MILCKDCKFYKSPRYIPDSCQHPKNIEVDFVSGCRFSKVNLRDFRRKSCGVDKAVYYESKED